MGIRILRLTQVLLFLVQDMHNFFGEKTCENAWEGLMRYFYLLNIEDSTK